MLFDDVLVSVIMPLRNAAEWLQETLDSIERQTFQATLQLSVFNDGSSDKSIQILTQWHKTCSRKIQLLIDGHDEVDKPKGVGFAKNRAVERSSGKFLCFLDADDVMMSQRIEKQLELAEQHNNAIVGCRFKRVPECSTERYTSWANSLVAQQLYYQIYTSHGPTLIMPTWFCSRNLFDKVQGFTESDRAIPEDLLFFYKHLDLGGILLRVDEELLVYRYHPMQITFTISEKEIWKIRFKRFEQKIVDNWTSFTIWNAGKLGRRFYRCLSEVNRIKVKSFCDVDVKKIGKFYTFEETMIKPKPKVPIIHFENATSPIVVCVKLGLTNGQFENNLDKLALREGIDFFHFG